tara:strand:- start:1772 stop:2164 length:393 start_codon:yes stop_codon:yes gene_type:complete
MIEYGSEALLQSAVIRYIKLKHPKVRYCASLGGQYQKHVSQRNKATATGYVKGFPDLQITEARGGYFGLFVEIKLDKRCYPSQVQKDWSNDLNERGYKSVITKGFDDTIQEIDNYLSEQATRTLCKAAAE